MNNLFLISIFECICFPNSVYLFAACVCKRLLYFKYLVTPKLYAMFLDMV